MIDMREGYERGGAGMRRIRIFTDSDLPPVGHL